jgi:hypothetical protein
MCSTAKKPSARKRTTSSTVRAAAPRRRTPALRSADAVSSRPSHEDIARRAYEIFLREGRHGQALDHWLQAEQELRHQR